MRSLARFVLAAVVLSSMSMCALAQSSQKAGTGVIAGRVMIGDKAAPGVAVLLLPSERGGPMRKAVAKAATDFEGYYRLTNVPAGRYSVTPIAPTMVGPNEAMSGQMGRAVVLAEGETVEKIDFVLTRGGVITGRITDAEGKPVVDERVQLDAIDNTNRGRFWASSNPFMFQTDDRGIYRIYGIPAGRYNISVGHSSQDGMTRVGFGNRRYFQRTYYPGETDIKKAAAIEVTEGGEAKDVDIKLGRRAQAFIATGRVVDAATGEPVANLIIGHGSYRQNERRLMGYGFGSRTDARGQFRIESLMPGRYAAFVWSENETYSDPVPFEITDGDISGIEIKLRRGATLSGVALIEGTSDKRILARLQQLYIGGYVQSKVLSAPANQRALIGADGQFRLTGIAPGKLMLYLNSYPPPKDLRLARVERDGAAQPNGIEITPGAEITNVRVIFEYGSGSLRGQVRVENGTLPEDARMYVMVARPNDPPERPMMGAEVDSRGRFLLEGLATGDYQLTLRAELPPGAARRMAAVKQTVSVTNGIETETTLVLDLAAKEKEADDK